MTPMALQQISEGRWLNPPKAWTFDKDALCVETGHETDFWQSTYYGFRRDNGHFWHIPAPSEFTATITFQGDYETLYDQAGMMVRIDDTHWIKLGIEHSDDITNFSIVVTRGQSDWSVFGQPLLSGPQSVRLTLKDNALIAHFQRPDESWQLMRVANFPMTADAMIGPMACSPQREGFKARFLSFQLTDPITNALHG